MRQVPKRYVESIEFAEARLALWTELAKDWGMSEEQIGLLEYWTQTARANYDEAIRAREAAEAASLAMRLSVAELRAMTSNWVGVITAYAQTGGELQRPPNEILAEALLTPPGKAGRREAQPEPPGRPMDIRASIRMGGAVEIVWTASNAAASSGGCFEVSRKRQGERAFTVIATVPGSTRKKRAMVFIDEAGVRGGPGTGRITYIITPRRGQRFGEVSDQIVVDLGGAGVGRMAA